MSHQKKLVFLLLIAILCIAAFLFIGLHGSWNYIFPKRLMKIMAMVLTGSAIAVATIIFQTITNNRILTPSVLGLDSLYVLIQTLSIFLFGSLQTSMVSKNMNFLLTVMVMMLFAGILFKMMFSKREQNIYFLLLVGIVIGTLFNSLSSFMQMLMDPNEFLIVQDKMFASFNNVKTELVVVSVILIVGLFWYVFSRVRTLDVLSLGREYAVNVGVDYDNVVKKMLVIIVIFISIATALVGPITFLGLIVVNLAYEILKTYRHSYLLTGSILLSIIVLVGGQLVVERVFTFTTTLSVIINFVGGLYFIFILVKGRTA